MRSEARLNVLMRLRQSTQSLHQALHRHPLLQDFTTDRTTVERYQAVIEAFYGFYRPLEPTLIAAAAEAGCPSRYQQPIRTTWLEQDLRGLGYSMAAVKSLACHRGLTRLSKSGWLAGCLYVIEGSTLGGKAIISSLSKHMNSEVLHSTHFFRGFREQTIPRWQNTCNFIRQVCDSSEQVLVASDTARLVFTALTEWLNEIATERGLQPPAIDQNESSTKSGTHTAPDAAD